METYAFWRPPVRTLTFEDFTTMQKQQGKASGEASALQMTGDGGRGAELIMAQLALSQHRAYVDSLGTKKTYSSMNNKIATGPANELDPESACRLYSEFFPKTIDLCDIPFPLLLITYHGQK